MKPKTKRTLVNSALLLVIFLFAQMLVPDFLALGMFFNAPREILIYVVVFGMSGAIIFMAWYNQKTEKSR
jgi:positive regulator of sigma E activity